MEVTALHSFTHGGESFKRNQVWVETPERAEAFRKAGLVRVAGGAAAGAKAVPAENSKPALAQKKPAARTRRKKDEQPA